MDASLRIAGHSRRGWMFPLRSIAGRAKRKLLQVSQVAWSAIREGVASTVYTLPPLADLNPRKRVARARDCCTVVTELPTNSRTVEDWYLPVREAETVKRRPSVCLDEIEAEKFRHGVERL